MMAVSSNTLEKAFTAGSSEAIRSKQCRISSSQEIAPRRMLATASETLSAKTLSLLIIRYYVGFMVLGSSRLRSQVENFYFVDFDQSSDIKNSAIFSQKNLQIPQRQIGVLHIYRIFLAFKFLSV
jgi:hypothetical protein